jgi:putative ABC transport system permease protein
MVEALLADCRYALRWLVRSPGFTLAALTSLAIGIGFNTALFSIVDALLFRPMPIERPERIVDIYTRGGDGDTYATNSYPDFLDWKRQNHVFQDMLGYSPSIAAVKAGEQSRMALGEVVTGNYFQLLGVRAALGRALLPADDMAGAPRAVMISHRLWTRDYANDPGVIGRTMTIHGQAYTIVGVAPREFTGMVPMLQPELWTPSAWVEEIEPAGIQDAVPSPTGNTRLERRGQRWMFVKARLKDGETLARAAANMQVITGQLAVAYPKTNEKRPVSLAAKVRIHPQADAMLRPIAAGLMVGIGLVLLIACANVANMLLARASARQREIGIRLAIGASRGRLIRQLLTEAVVLSLLGGAAGVAVASLLLALVNAVPLPLPVPLALALRMDARVLMFTLGVASAAGLAAGLAPAFRATRPDLVGDLKGEGSIVQTRRRRWSLRDALVGMQTAVTLVLLVAAGLLTRSILAAHRVDLGFATDGLVAVSTELSLVGYDDDRASQLYARALERVQALPGVRSASRAVRQPLAINYNRNTVFFPDHQQSGDQGIPIAATWVDEHYFTTLGVPLVRGRNFSTADNSTSPKVAIVNQAFVHRYWPSGDALGRRFRLRTAAGPEYEVVGVVSNYKVETVGEPPTPYIHYALGQRTFSGNVIIARTATEPEALVSAIRGEILAMEPNAIFLESQPMRTLVDATLLPARLAAQTIALVGAVATALAAIGLYGVIAYAVARRTRELGIRMALGSSPSRVLALVMREGLTVAVAGVLVGAVLSWIAARAIASALYGVGAGDPAAWAGAIAVLLGAAALANYVPARRASRVDPSVALRQA